MRHSRIAETARQLRAVPDVPKSGLVKLGYAAVAQLIEALADERMTRSVGYGRASHFSHYILRVGDCAYGVLQRIAHRNFYVASTTHLLKDGSLAETRAAIEPRCETRGPAWKPF